MNDDPARTRWLIISLVRLAASAGAVLGIILLAKAQDTPIRVLGIAIVLASLWMMAIVPKALVQRWRSPK